MLTNLSQLMGGVMLRIEHRKGCRDSGWGEMFVKNPRFEYSLAGLNQSIKLFIAMFDIQLVARDGLANKTEK